MMPNLWAWFRKAARQAFNESWTTAQRLAASVLILLGWSIMANFQHRGTASWRFNYANEGREKLPMKTLLDGAADVSLTVHNTTQGEEGLTWGHYTSA